MRKKENINSIREVNHGKTTPEITFKGLEEDNIYW